MNSIASFFSALRRPSAVQLLLLMVVVLIIGVCGWQRASRYEQTIAEANADTLLLARSIAQHGMDNIDKADLILSSVVHQLERPNQRAPALANMADLFQWQLQQTPVLRNLILLDAAGQVQIAARTSSGQSRDQADAEYFIWHRAHTDKSPYLAAPVQAGGSWIFTVSRRIDHADGSFAGVVLAALASSFFQKYYDDVNIGERGLILLARNDRTTMLHRPFVAAILGQRARGKILFEQMDADQRSGNLWANSGSDGVARVVGYQRFDKYPLVVAVALDQDEVLARWRTGSMILATLVLLILALLGLLMYRLQLQSRLRMVSETRLRMITDSLPMLVSYTDRQQRYRFLNQTFEKWTGRKIDSLLDLSVLQFVGPDAYALSLPYLEAALAGTAGEFEYLSTVRGTEQHLRVQYLPQANRHGEVEGVVTIVTDISADRLRERSLLQSRESLNQAQALAHLGSWEYDLATGEQSWSDEMYRIHGYAPQSVPLTWNLVVDAIYFEDRSRVVAAYRQAIDTPCGYHLQTRIVRPDGTVRTLLITAEVMRDEQGRAHHLIGVFFDITERAEIERKFTETDHLLRMITNSLPVLVAYINHRGNYVYNNAAFETMTGVPLADTNGASTVTFAACHAAAMTAMKGSKSTIEFMGEGKYSKRILRGEFLPQFDDFGVTQGVVAVIADVTDAHTAQHRLQTSERLLGNAQKIAHVGSWEFDYASNAMIWSLETYHLFGLRPYSVAHLDQDFLTSMMHPADRDAALREREHKLAMAGEYVIEYRIVRPDGEVRYLIDRAETVLDKDLQPIKLIGAIIDVTTRKRIELALVDVQQREMAIGYDIQQSLLMADVPTELSGAWVATHVEPSQGLHGDFVAVSQHSPTRFNLLIGDVMGKGIHAAMIGAGVKNTYYQVLAELMAGAIGDGHMPGPAVLINALHARMTPKLMSMNSFVTLALHAFDVEAGTVTFVNAGHTPALLARFGVAQVEILEGANLPLGVVTREIYTEQTVRVSDDDQLVVYSDGISEASNRQGEEFGLQGITDWLAQCNLADVPSSAALQLLRQKLGRALDDGKLADDQTLMIVRLRPVRNPPRQSIAERRNADYLTMPMRLDALPVLRERLLEITQHWPAELAESLLLAIFEAATNAIRHNPLMLPDASLTWRLTPLADRLTVELFYLGQPVELPATKQPDFSGASDGGFGLHIMRSILDEVSYDAPLPGLVRVLMVKRIQA